jgi:hypothetical protein
MTNTWSHTFDFTQTSGGFRGVLGSDNTPRGTYLSSVGWQSIYNNAGVQFNELRLLIPILPSTTYTSFMLVYSSALVPNQISIGLGTDTSIDQHADLTADAASGMNVTVLATGQSILGTSLRLDISDNYAASQNTITLSRLVIAGVGDNPYLDHYCVACALNHIAIDIEEVLDALG